MSRGSLIIFLALIGLVLGVPFALRPPPEESLGGTARKLVIITPHNEAIRYEFGRGFRLWHQEKYGEAVSVDWRVVGGTSEIARFLAGEYEAAFQAYWGEHGSGGWDGEVSGAWNNRRLKLPDNPADDDRGQAARRLFLSSNVSSGLDVFFGGGVYDHRRQGQMGHTVPSRILQTHPEWFGPDAIPQSLSGEPYFDPAGLWLGTALSSYGIIFNRDVLKDLGVTSEPGHWQDLTDPRFFGQVAVCDPTKSGSITQAFEMIIQQQMQESWEALKEQNPGDAPEIIEDKAVREGWEKAWQLIRKLSANARYFTDSSMKPSIDVSLGDAAIGMSIDFYGKYQAQSLVDRGGSDRFGFHSPVGGTTISVDPISLLRGSPEQELAERFIEFVLSVDGQKLWNYRKGTPGGPDRFALRRAPVRPDLYQPEHRQYFSDPDFLPYEQAGSFYYHASWTGPLFGAIRTLVKATAMNPHHELALAWKKLAEAGFPEEQTSRFLDVSAIHYDWALEVLNPVLQSGDRIEETRFLRELTESHREVYLQIIQELKE